MQDEKEKSLQILGKGVKTLRLKRKWKLSTLAYRIGLSSSTITRIEKGENEPKYYTLKRIAEAFGYNLSEFFEIIENLKN